MEKEREYSGIIVTIAGTIAGLLFFYSVTLGYLFFAINVSYMLWFLTNLVFFGLLILCGSWLYVKSND